MSDPKRRPADEDGYTEYERPFVELRNAWITFLTVLARSLGMYRVLDWVARRKT